jgi:hypothetical protein
VAGGVVAALQKQPKQLEQPQKQQKQQKQWRFLQFAFLKRAPCDRWATVRAPALAIGSCD